MGATQSVPVVDLGGKVAIITGGNAGIGYETAKAIAAMGARTIIACRSPDKAATAIEQMKREINEKFPDKSLIIEPMPLDLASFKSTKDFTVAFKEKQLPLHILINNAATMGSSTTAATTDDGFELVYQVNHLSHFLLTIELLPVMLETAAICGDCRIVIVSSISHNAGVFDPDNMNQELKPHALFVGGTSYNRSKLYNVMHAYALQRHLQNVNITVSVLHPGQVNTEMPEKTGYKTHKVVKFIAKPFMMSIEAGAAASVNCAVNPNLNSQQCYYYHSDTKVASSSSLSQNETLQEELWKISCGAVKEWMSPELYDKYVSVGREQPLETTTEAEDTTLVTEETMSTTN